VSGSHVDDNKMKVHMSMTIKWRENRWL